MKHDVFSMVDARTADVLARLHKESDRQTPRILAGLAIQLPALLRGNAPGPPRGKNDPNDGNYLALGKAAAAFCYSQARAIGARSVVEFGTSFGVSTIWLAAAVRDNGGGTVIGSELVASKAARARQNLRSANLDQYVDVRVGDARDTLADIEGPIDLLLNDGAPDAAFDVLRRLAPRLRPGAVVITDNVGVMRGAYAPYLAWLRDPANGFVSVRLPFRNGTEMSVRTT